MKQISKCELRAMEERTANYPGYRDESTMEVIRHESLGIYIYAKPKNQTEQKYNLNLTARAEAIDRKSVV